MKITRLTLGLLLAVTAATPLHAQVSAFTYQGRLNLNGTPANGHYDFMFRLLNDPTNGTATPVIPINLAVPVTNGLFTTGMDFGAENFDGANCWLEINVRTNGGGAFTTLSPRQQITSTPYAIHSANAASVSGSVSATQLTGTISSNNIAAGMISGPMLATGAVGSNQLAIGAVTTDALANGAVTGAKIARVSVQLLTTVANPTPGFREYFGHSVAAVGTDRILIGAFRDDRGANDAGAAYLLSTDGALLAIFGNPTPETEDDFGYSVAAVGTDRVLIGAPYDDVGATDSGAAYLFSTDGALLTTFTNPTPEFGDWFGSSVAAIGSDRVLIGAQADKTGAWAAGAAYLFSTNGALLTTITNPTPVTNDKFGFSLAAVWPDWVLIGATTCGSCVPSNNVGAAYLLSTNGALITTFTNPVPSPDDGFGFSVAAVASDRVLIGAHRDDTGTSDAGAAYLFSTNGALLTTFTNPMPAAIDRFGNSVAAVASDRVLIGAYLNDTGAEEAGVVYLFSTNGALITTITNPAPATDDYFGVSVATLGTDRILIGAYGDNTGTTDAGAAYLFSLESFTPGLVAEGVKAGSITTGSLEDGAVTAAKLDPTIGLWTHAGDNVFRLAGNVGIGTSSFTSNRLEVAGMVGATAFNTTSDRAAKEDFTVVDAQAVLAKVAALPITQWRFKEFPSALHLGPMAQDFREAFGLGMDDKHIATVDADGVALAAIQGLNQKLEETRAENAELRKRMAELERVVQRLSVGAPVSDPAR